MQLLNIVFSSGSLSSSSNASTNTACDNLTTGDFLMNARGNGNIVSNSSMGGVDFQVHKSAGAMASSKVSASMACMKDLKHTCMSRTVNLVKRMRDFGMMRKKCKANLDKQTLQQCKSSL